MDERNALSRLPELADVNTDQQDKGMQTSLVIDPPNGQTPALTPEAQAARGRVAIADHLTAAGLVLAAAAAVTIGAGPKLSDKVR
jgi:hypothetical protein